MKTTVISGAAQAQEGDRDHRPAIALCIYDYPWTVSPSILNSAQLLAEAGYEVDLLVRRYPSEPFTLGHPAISVISYLVPESAGSAEVTPQPLPKTRHLVKQLLPDAAFRWLSPIRRVFWSAWIEYRWFRAMAEYAAWLRAQHRRRNYTALIGMDRSAVIPAVWACRGIKTQVVYFSLEIHLSGGDRRFRSRLLKRLERYAHRRVAFTIVQDRERARHLAQDNGVDPEDFFLVPVAALGETYASKTTYLHERLGIPGNKRLVLSAGGIAHYNLCAELARSAQGWPEDWVLVIHGYVPDPTYLDELRPYCTDGKVHLSTELVPYEDLDALMASADVGVALYKDLGPNFQHIALSSGKLAQYVKVGLPVVVTAFPGVQRLLETERCGIGVVDVDEVQDAITQILASYASFRDAAFDCYRRRYDMRVYFDAVLERLQSVTEQRGVAR